MHDTEKMKYMKLLARTYKNIDEASTEIINLQAILSLPKGTEHFVSDIHGENEAFGHVLRNASGVIKNYIDELFGNSLMEHEKKNLATLIYYPAKRLEIVRKLEDNMDEWYRIQLFRLIRVCKRVSSKYTRSKVRKSLPREFAFIIEELIHEDSDRLHKHAYYNEIIDSIIRLDRAGSFITAISNVIQRLAIDHLHVLGDIYDRGGGAAQIMDILQDYHSVDVQWGNHDILWMGAASGSDACICNVIRISAKYGNLDTIEEEYGINLIPLATFAMERYTGDIPEKFCLPQSAKHSEKELDLAARMHKAVTVIQLKVESEIIRNHPEYGMDDRLLLDKIDFQNKTVTIGLGKCELTDADFPTIDEGNPFTLSGDEREVMEKLRYSFRQSEKLQRHVRFLFNKGSMYTVFNSNLLFHGCIPLNEDGALKETELFGEKLSGKMLLDKMDATARKGCFSPKGSDERRQGLDFMWYLWCGPDSPLYGKDKMSTFERYFTNCRDAWEESKDPYYSMRDAEDTCRNILRAFGLSSESSRIINGHVPVEVAKGENPVKAKGKMIVIDGGFAKAYQAMTGIAGYTLIYNSQGLLLSSHEPFVSMHDAIENNTDIISDTNYIERCAQRKKVEDTDIGESIRLQIADLEDLLGAYRNGDLKETR